MSLPMPVMHEHLSGAVAGTHHFQNVRMVHTVSRGDAMNSANVAMIETVLMDGRTLTVWADGTIQVTDDDSEYSACTNYRVRDINPFPATPGIDVLQRIPAPDPSLDDME